MPENTSPKTISWPKVIITVLVIVLVAGLISGVLFWYFLVRQPTESTPVTTNVATASSKTATPSAQKGTAGWKFYQNSKFGFSIKYPPNTLVDRGTEREDTTSIWFYYPSKSPYEWFYGVVVTPAVRKNLEEVRTAYSSSQGKYDNFQEITIDGVKALKFDFTREGASNVNEFFVVALRGDKEVQISLTLLDESLDLSEMRKTFNLILPTFKFL